MAILPRNKVLYLVKAVPVRFQAIETRKQVWLSLKTDSMKEAKTKEGLVWKNMLAMWEAKLAGKTGDALERYDAARHIAGARGLLYLELDEVAELPMADIAARVEAITFDGDEPDDMEVQAALGLVKKPALTVSQALEEFWVLSEDKLLNKSDDQKRRWQNPYKKAIRNFIEVVGDVALESITADEMRQFRLWWSRRLEDEGLTANSANKDLSHIKVVLQLVNEDFELGLQIPKARKFKAQVRAPRPPFPDKFIRDVLLSPGALDGLNLEARVLVLGMINTGYRPSEAACLTRAQIRLDTDIPHISIEPVGRELKSEYSVRQIPLVGVSLEAFRQCPDGFPRYADNAGLSDTVNKFLRENSLVPSPDHTMYSLRHAFEDRMLAAEFDERIRRDLFGHTLNRQRYGAGASLEHKHRLLQGIAL